MVLERQIGTVDVHDLEVGHRLSRWILVAIFVRRQRMGVGVRETVFAGDARHDRVLEHHGGVATLEIPAVEPKPNEQGVGV
jgi:hypothetical protein